MISNTVAVKISSVEECKRLIEYYVQEYGYYTKGLTIGNCMRYPHIHIYEGEKRLISGESRCSIFDRVLSFDEWCEEELRKNEIESLPDISLLFNTK